MHPINRPISQLFASALLALSMLSFAIPTVAAERGNLTEAEAHYQQDRALCLGGQSGESQATCLREAGAALSEAKRGRLGNGSAHYSQNALNRCKAQPKEDQEACRARIDGGGVTSGSVTGGGVLREYREVETPAAPESGNVSPSDTAPNGIAK
ncbi:MAG: hypothetical protein ABI351_11885 [Herbaspirillum sp.]